MKLSIITINRNNKSGLQKTIESVVSQTFKDYEYIVIDGTSTDGSVDVIKQYADKITYWVSEPDKGIYNAMNKGILQAKGEYCLFMNSGDVLYDILVLEKIFSQNISAEIINGDLIKVYPDRDVLSKSIAFLRKKKGESLTLKDMLVGNLDHQSTLIKRALFDEYGLYAEDYKIVSDWIFLIQSIGLAGVRVEYVDVIISKFDMLGICNTEVELLRCEREKAIEAYVPSSILDDYQYYIDMEIKYKKITSYTCFKMIARLYNLFFRKNIKF